MALERALPGRFGEVLVRLMQVLREHQKPRLIAVWLLEDLSPDETEALRRLAGKAKLHVVLKENNAG